MQENIVQNAVNTLRFLSVDCVQNARSGHPGFPMGAAAIAYTIWMRHMKFSPEQPGWMDRDRFILSGGHGSAMLYSLLYLVGSISLDDLKHFRQWGSITPGHPEYGLTPGVDATTGPLGQGFANGVGMAMAESHLAARYNRSSFDIIDHYTYAIVTDGDLMEGITSEAASLAGHLRLGKLIYCYDDNHITIDGSTDLSFSEDCAVRFSAYGWHVQRVEDGNDVQAIDDAILRAKDDERPSLIICRTHIGYGSPKHQDKSSCHGSPLGEDEIRAAKEKLGFPIEPAFFVADEVQSHFKEIAERGSHCEADWQDQWRRYQRQYPEEALCLAQAYAGVFPLDWENVLKQTEFSGMQSIATRSASGKALNLLSNQISGLMGGSADLTSSTAVRLVNEPVYSKGTPQGRNLHFGVREHAMGAIINGMAYHKGFVPFCATYLVFSDYLKPALRLAALSKLQTIWVMTHDSFFVGQDGSTHQPVEQLMSLRLIPGVTVIRPADGFETFEAWKTALNHKDKPVVLVLSRQEVPLIHQNEFSSAHGLSRGAYILADVGGKKPEMILMASGSEVSLIIEAGRQLAEQGYGVRLVSFPSWELFEAQEQVYRDAVLPHDIPLRLAVEAGATAGWERWVGPAGRILGIDHFGASAPPEVLAEQYGFTPDHVLRMAKVMLSQKK